MAILSVLTIWLRAELLDTDTYVSSVSAVVTNPAVEASVANVITNQIFTNVDVEGAARDALPPRAQSFAPQLADGLRSFTHNVTFRVVSSKQFENLWIGANRRAHQQIVAVLTGQPGPRGAVSTAGGQVTLDLSSVTATVNQRLLQSGINVFQNSTVSGPNGGKVVLVKSSQLESLQGVVRVFRHLTVLLPILTVLCLAGAVFASRDRRRGLVRAGRAVVVAMVILTALLFLLRGVYFEGVVTPNFSKEAAAALFSGLIGFLRWGVLVSFLVGLVVALGAALAGPSRPAVWVRESTVSSVRFVGQRAKMGRAGLGPVGRWVGRYRTPLRIGIVVVGLIVLFAWSNPGVWVVLGVILGVLLLLWAIEAIARGYPPAETAGDEPASEPPSPPPSTPAPPAVGSRT
ncbi:MAG TPA: hypothetical protein VG476_15515 [Acidimicrobiales bacterium]|nr:hypothetical protein [Acidimicrobiales bacterium]